MPQPQDQVDRTRKPQTQIVITDGAVGIVAVVAIMVAVTFVAMSASQTTGLAGAPMRIEALPLPEGR
ncbi:MAG: hypothetical protein AAF366_12220 [Pseudomonadota bacterium]